MTSSLWTGSDVADLAFPGTKDVPGQHRADVQCTMALMTSQAKLGSRPSFLLFLSSQLCRLWSTKSHPSLSFPKKTTIVFSSPLQPPFLWCWFLLIIGLMKAIITEVWMTNALATFHGVFVNSNPPSNGKMDSGGGSSESSCLLDYSKKPSPKNWSVNFTIAILSPSLVSFDCSSTPHETEVIHTHPWEKPEDSITPSEAMRTLVSIVFLQNDRACSFVVFTWNCPLFLNSLCLYRCLLFHKSWMRKILNKWKCYAFKFKK